MIRTHILRLSGLLSRFPKWQLPCPDAAGPAASPGRDHNGFGMTDVGNVRERNEDAFYISPDFRLFVVADGLGGHAAGEVASALAVDAVRQTMLDPDGKLHAGRDVKVMLVEAFGQSHAFIRAHAIDHPECAGMGTTLIVAVVQGDRLTVAHVGDVRGYRHGRDGLARLTMDHSIVARMVREGSLSEAEAAWHPLRNSLYKVVGDHQKSRPDVACCDITPGEFLLLCSDGLWNEVSDGMIANILEQAGTVRELVTALVDRANDAGGRDNITAVLYRHGG
jgi:serine/threonine protein phosphatase PrpC